MAAERRARDQGLASANLIQAAAEAKRLRSAADDRYSSLLRGIYADAEQTQPTPLGDDSE